jgi:hypothetical protein
MAPDATEFSARTRIVLTPGQLVSILLIVLGLAGFLTDLRFQVQGVRAAVVDLSGRVGKLENVRGRH